MMDLSFSKPGEIVKRLCDRLRAERLAQQNSEAVMHQHFHPRGAAVGEQNDPRPLS